MSATFVIHVRLPGEQGTAHTVEGGAGDTVKTVLEKVAAELQLDVSGFTLHHDGVALDELSENVTQTTLGEGSEVEARPSAQFVARRELEDMGLGWGVKDVQLAVSARDERGDSAVAAVVHLMMEASGGEHAMYLLSDAAREGHLETARVVSPWCKNKEVALQIAAADDHLEVVRHLVETGADIHSASGADSENSTALHCAAFWGSMKAVRYLVEVGANLGATDAKGNTPLHDAAENSMLDVVEYLVGEGSDTNARTAAGKTPHDIAKRSSVSAFLESVQ